MRLICVLDDASNAIEIGGQSAWIDEPIDGSGHDLVVANAHHLRMIAENESKSGEVDGKQLTRVTHMDLPLLHPMQQRQRSPRANLAKAGSRIMLIATQPALINHVPGC